jgi:uncharacterized protein (DUF885 family)
LDQVIEGLQVRESKGIIPPKFAVEKVIDQIKGFLAPGPQRNTLTASFKGEARQDSGGPDGREDGATRSSRASSRR